MSTCHQLHLQTLGSPPVMPKNLHDQCSSVEICTHQVPVKGVACAHLGLWFWTFWGLWRVQISTLVWFAGAVGNGTYMYQLIAHPHLVVWDTSEQ
jgi:hypothetical protein